MTGPISAKTQHRLDIQGFDDVDAGVLSEIAPWQRMAFALCATLAATGTLLASPVVLLTLAVIAALAAMFPVHPFDLIYNHGIRYIRGTGPLPKRGIPGRFACGMGVVCLVVTVWAFSAGYSVAGYLLGGALTGVATLVSTTDVCIPSMIYRSVFGAPQPRSVVSEGARDSG